MNDSQFDVSAPERLLGAIAAAELRAPLPPSVSKLVADALAARTWPMLATASRALRVLERLSREEGRPTTEAVTQALAEVRRAMRELRSKGRL